MNPGRKKTACLAVFVLEAALAALGLWLLDNRAFHAVMLFAVWLVAYDHPKLTIWRAPSTLIVATSLTATLTVLSLFLLNAWTPLHCRIDLPTVGLFLLIPTVGHLSPILWTQIRPKKLVYCRNQGRARRRASEALSKTPGCLWRLTDKPHEATGELIIPPAPPHDYLARIRIPNGQLRLFRELPDRGMSGTVKRTMDLSIALMISIPSLLLFIPLAILVRFSMGSPVIYQQLRLTQGGRPFRIHKLRSMGTDAEPGNIPVWPAEHDPRITPLGRTLRRFWLDEIPQVADVLRGPLSLVGPRPERPHFVEEFSRDMSNYPMRHQVRSGVTGLAQVSGFVGNTSLQRRLHLDLRYIRNWSPVLDLSLMLATVTRVFRRPPIESGATVSACEERSPSPPKRL